MLVTEARYRAITGDNATAVSAVSALIEEATDLLEERLDRKLPAIERTERMYPTRDGSLWPHAVPVTVADGYVIDGYRLTGSWPSSAVDLVTGTNSALVTYTGGWVERTANPDADNRLPGHIERDIAWAAYALQITAPGRQAIGTPIGATAVSLGDVSVSFGPGGARSNPGKIPWTRATLGYRWQRIGGN